MTSFSGRVAAVTGAGSGIGRALALALARAGCQLALSDVREEALEETAEAARTYGVGVTTAAVDVSDRDGVFAWARRVGASYGEVHLLVNNAGVALGSTIDDPDYARDLRWLMDINFLGVVNGCEAFLPLLEASGDGRIVNVSSALGFIGLHLQTAYCASKFAVRGYSEALRQDLEMRGRPVAVTVVHPGGIKTNIARAARISSSLVGTTFENADDARLTFERFFNKTPEHAASIILEGVRKRRFRVRVGWDAVFLDWLVRLCPSSYHHLVGSAVRRTLERRPARKSKAA